MVYDGGDEFSAKGLLENKGVVLFYFALLLVLVFLIVWYLRQGSSKTSEHYYGYGMPDSYQVLASGPDVRFQQFTSTNQGETPINMADIKQMYPNLHSNEKMSAGREPPVFYDISQTLGEYQYASKYSCADGNPPMPVKNARGHMSYACVDGSTPVSSNTEHAVASPATAVQEALLMRQLGY